MPTGMLVGPYRFFFYSNEGNEPPHIHIAAGGNAATYWLLPVSLASTRGFTARELRDIENIIHAHVTALRGAWDAHHVQP